jgi:hypothetical protein
MLGLGNEIPGPYHQVANLYNADRFKDRTSFVRAHSGTRDGTLMNKNLGVRNSVYEQTSGQVPDNNFTNMNEQVEKVMGNCRPCVQDTAPAYGPPGAPNAYTSYPVRAQFENRKKWNDMFASPFTQQGKTMGGGGGGSGSGSGSGQGNVLPKSVDKPTPGGELKSYHPVPTQQQPILMGCNIVSSGEDQYAHRMTYMNNWFNEDNGEILIQPPKTIQSKYIGSYSDELFKTPIDNTENKISTGIMTNPYTGEMYETFENAMPPPNTDKYIPADRFEMANPKLLQMFGGVNDHAPKPKKKEVCLDVPGTDFGNNVWGDQLYEEERRKRMFEIVNRELWNSRNGDYSTTSSVAKEKPAGFVGVQQMYRALPYLPPTQELDSHNYIPVSDYTHAQPEMNSVKSEVFVRKPDLTSCVYQQPAGPLNDQEVEYVIGQYENRPTWRGGGDTYYAGTPFLPNHGTSGPQQTENRSTMKEFMEQTFQPTNAQTSVLESGSTPYVLQQYENKSTLKEQMEQSFEASGAVNHVVESGGAAYVVSQYENRSTLKESMEQNYAPTNAVTAILETGQTPYVVSQYENRPTLKEAMEQTFQPSNTQTAILETGSTPYVISQYENRSTLREFMETEFPTTVVDPSRPENGYVVSQYENKPTLKQLMQQSFDMGNFADERTGAYIEFQGPLEEVRRAYYEKMPSVGRPAGFSDGVGGDYVGNGSITSKQNRGVGATNWVEPSKIPQDAGDVGTRWIGQYDRDTKREPVQNIPMSDLAPHFQSVAPRMLGALTARCNTDLHETDDEFSWSHGFAPQVQEVITG